jgi:glycine cleavage system aminomethyltransferase T
VSAGYDALRGSVALLDAGHVHALRVSGPGAFELLDRACGRDLYLQNGRLIHGLALREDGTPLADLYLGGDDDAFLLLAEGPRQPLLDLLEAARPAGRPAAVQELGEEAGLLTLAGPYAWELLGEVLGPEVIGLPYLTFMQAGGVTCFRTGKTGEYGFDLLAPRPALGALRARLLEAGRGYGLAEASLDDFDQAALENWFFNVRREGGAGLTPLELQLQWRVSRRKDYVGAAALAARRAAGVRQRVTTAVAPSPVAAGQALRHLGRPVGAVLNAGRCAPRGDWVALCLLDLALAAPGVALQGEGGVPLTTVSPPVLANRSLFVHPQRHAWASRERDRFPPLCEGTDAAV